MPPYEMPPCFPTTSRRGRAAAVQAVAPWPVVGVKGHRVSTPDFRPEWPAPGVAGWSVDRTDGGFRRDAPPRGCAQLQACLPTGLTASRSGCCLQARTCTWRSRVQAKHTPSATARHSKSFTTIGRLRSQLGNRGNCPIPDPPPVGIRPTQAAGEHPNPTIRPDCDCRRAHFVPLGDSYQA